MRLAFAVAGVGPVILAARVDDLPLRLVGIAVALVFLGPLVGVLVGDIRRWLGGVPPPAPDPWPSHPAGRPPAIEWVVAVAFNGSCALLVWAGALAAHTAPELLGGSLGFALVMAGLNVGLVRRWWRSRQNRS
ncbi:hypothetical protein [Actinomadura rubrisoli]|uniref:Uncharacterized protein n=1 Tax=Actinomadura rubrisoli TaxID=2530368 RepID=A0A4R5AQ97_9ACTN|nr:hypothetical protein [Actinomadura rubrisoli]TDD73224.1 hypothetical protein E1298_34470 [Actinomadura rubrisoli]